MPTTRANTELEELLAAAQTGRRSRRAFLTQAAKLGLPASLAATLFAGAAAGAGAAPGRQTSTGRVAPQQGTKTLVVAIAEETLNLDPALAAADGFGDMLPITDNLAEGLTRFKVGTTEVEPALAASWDVSTDGLTYVFHLRPNVTFHDGTPLDAKAVEFNFVRQLDAKSPYHDPKMTYTEIIFADVASVKATGPLDLTITLTRPTVLLLGNLAVFAAGIVSPTALQKYGKDFSTHAAGTGPFKLDHWTKGVELVFAANDAYWGGRPPLDRVVWQTIPDDTVRLTALKTGSIDVANQIDFKDVSGVKRTPGLQAIGGTFLDVQFVAFNEKLPPFDSLPVRQAVQHAINKPNIAQAVFYGTYTLGAGPIAPGLLGYDPALANVYPYDPAKAKALLKQAHPATTTIDLYNRANTFWPLIGQLIQSDLAAVGLTANLKSLQDADFYALLNASKAPAFINDWNWDNGDPDNVMFSLFTAPRAMTRMAYHNPQVDTFNVQAQTEHDPTQRARLYDQAQQLIMQDAIMVVLGYPGRVIGAKSTVQHLVQAPVGTLVLREVSLGG